MNTSRRQFLARTAVGVAVVAGGSFGADPASALISSPAGAAAGTTRTTTLTDVTVIDVATGRRNRRQTVLISGERIVAVGRNLPVPRGATTIDLTGKFVIPGLADMHVHALDTDEVDPPLHLANGVTTLRVMSGDPRTYEWRDRIDAGTLLGPRMVVASQI